MEHALLTQARERISSGLKRKAVTRCSTWAESYRLMGQPFPGPWSFKHHPWAREMHDCEAELMVGQKAAQMGYTEVALNKVFYSIDIRGISCLYILPSEKPDASDFSTSRFDPALEMSEHLRNIFSDVRNIGHKRAGSANLFVRGSRSRSQMKSIPVGIIIFDEVDEMVQENIPLAMERSSGQVEKQAFMLSTPTIDNIGINASYRNSTAEHFFFKCPKCSRQTELTFPECLIITAEDVNDMAVNNSQLICKECKGELRHEDKVNFLKDAKWVASHTDREPRGFHINQMYSMAAAGRPSELAKSFLRAKTNPADEQEFFNSKLGKTHVVEGARVTDSQIKVCTGDYTKAESATGLITMGVDVGKWLHYEIRKWDITGKGSDINSLAKCQVITEGKVIHFEELDVLMQKFRVSFCVIDANPERRKALEFAQRFWGHVKLCFYGNAISGKNISVHGEEEHTITVDRTSWIDISLGRFKNKTIKIPQDVSTEYKSGIKALVRIYEKDVNGNPVGRYVKGNDEDHFAHACNYAEIALPFAAGISQSHNISKVS